MNRNNLQVGNNYIHFNNFNEIKKDVTFCFLPAGIVIMNEKADDKPHRFHTELDESGNVYNENVISKLKARGVSDSISFFYNNGMYFEMVPHPITDEEIMAYTK